MRLGSRGQATVELIAAVPLVLTLAALAWQVALAARSAGFAATAARSGARALAIGRDPKAAAAASLPGDLASGLRLQQLHGGRVRVFLKVPAAVDGLDVGNVSSSAAFVGQAR